MDQFLQLCTYQSVTRYEDCSQALEPLFFPRSSSTSTLIRQPTPPQQPQPTLLSPHLLLVYLTLPPHVFATAAQSVRTAVQQRRYNDRMVVRLVVEKPFGRDTESFHQLQQELLMMHHGGGGGGWHEPDLFRIDHYLGKVLVQNMLHIRQQFAGLLSALPQQMLLQAVHIVWKETVGTEGRGGYFDTVGIVRDVMQNHLLQILALLGMDYYSATTTTNDGIRQGKVDFLQHVASIAVEDCVRGQYNGYTDDPSLSVNQQSTTKSNTETYACVRLRIKDPNHAWHGVPIVLEAGKALDEHLCEARLYWRSSNPVDSESTQDTAILRLRVQPDPAVLWTVESTRTMTTKKIVSIDEPGTTTVSRGQIRYREHWLPYATLLLEAIHGRSDHFVRDDELVEAWRIFTPLLHAFEKGRGQQPRPLCYYEPGSAGPEPEQKEFLRAGGVPGVNTAVRPRTTSILRSSL